MRFIYAHDGTAINVRHIITMFVQATSKGDGFVVRCRTSLSGGEYVIEHAIANLSPVLSGRDAAELWLKSVIDKLSPR